MRQSRNTLLPHRLFETREYLGAHQTSSQTTDSQQLSPRKQSGLSTETRATVSTRRISVGPYSNKSTPHPFAEILPRRATPAYSSSAFSEAIHRQSSCWGQKSTQR